MGVSVGHGAMGWDRFIAVGARSKGARIVDPLYEYTQKGRITDPRSKRGRRLPQQARGKAFVYDAF
jgi:hypothetical protein